MSPPGDLPDPGMEPMSLASAGRFSTSSATWEAHKGSLLLLSHFSHVQLCATPSLGFSRQEHWSGLPFPSPMHKSEK